ncbi:MAG: preprotein translocase subunit YajC [Bacteroidales bacterium]|jgi:preprotein translocase subunit YajC|nr:preprotein translocase subunit YajC [Bacteroidales bacterium]
MFNTIFLQEEAAAAENPMGAMNLLFIIGIIVVFYFFMIRPQKKQQQKIEEERNNMKVGDNVITNGGMFGKIESVNTATDKKGKTVVTSFVIKLKPDYQTRIEISKDCVFKDLNSMNASVQK